jgi:hypothetical protein
MYAKKAFGYRVDTELSADEEALCTEGLRPPTA